MNTETINNTSESTQNVNTEATTKVSLGKRIWNGTKTAAKCTAGAALTIGYIAVNVAVVALPIAACVKYLRED